MIEKSVVTCPNCGFEKEETMPEAKELVDSVGRLSIRFNIPQQTQWLLVLTLVLTSLIITLIGLYAAVFGVV